MSFISAVQSPSDCGRFFFLCGLSATSGDFRLGQTSAAHVGLMIGVSKEALRLSFHFIVLSCLLPFSASPHRPPRVQHKQLTPFVLENSIAEFSYFHTPTLRITTRLASRFHPRSTRISQQHRTRCRLLCPNSRPASLAFSPSPDSRKSSRPGISRPRLQNGRTQPEDSRSNGLMTRVSSSYLRMPPSVSSHHLFD